MGTTMAMAETKKMIKSTRQSTPLFIVLCLGAILGSCTALSIQSNPLISVGYRRTVVPSHRPIQRAASTKLLSSSSNLHTEPSYYHGSGTRLFGRIFRSIKSSDSLEGGDNGVEINRHDLKEKTTHNLLQSIALVATGRRTLFLVLSATMVNFVRNTILKIPKSDKKMFDACPWPFTLFHDPPQFIKDGATHVVVVWVALCQIYSQYEKARVVLP